MIKRTIILAFSALLTMSCGGSVNRYMNFLYDSMPLPDRMVHNRDWWETNVEKTLEVRDLMDWNVPEREFRHFVLPLRVNNEALDDFRLVYADSLCERVRGMTMAEAALELNHWCHERATYRPSDARTSSPMATIRAGLGRCGEESVLAVAALRAAGIPARQVYTPRWAHTDDNHAWVEVYVDGQWHFMGACEPEAALDMAWFNAPVSRAMLLHTKVFGDYHGDEDVISRTKVYTEINVIRGYVPSRRNTVTVIDNQGHPVEGAKVEFRIYNYAEFYPVASCLTDARGQASLETGLGDIFVWASYGDHYGFTLMSGSNAESGGQRTAELSNANEAKRAAEHSSIDDEERAAEHSSIDDGERTAELSNANEAKRAAEHSSIDDEERAAEHSSIDDGERTAELSIIDDGQRTAEHSSIDDGERTAEFSNANEAKRAAELSSVEGAEGTARLNAELRLTHKFGKAMVAELHIVPPMENPLPANASPEAVAANAQRLAAEDAMREARPHGNHAVLDAFKAAHPGQEELCESIVSSLSIKDLNDVTLEVLEDALAHAGTEFDPYTDCPRIEMEALHPYFGEIGAGLTLAGPRDVWQWTQDNIRIDSQSNPQMLRIPPVFVWRERLADAHSRDIFYVALCRALGFPARIDEVTGKVQYAEDGRWNNIKTEVNAPQGSLKLNYGPQKPVKSPEYYTHFTLSAVRDGSTRLLTFDESGDLHYDTLFGEPMELDEGDYLLTTGRRLADGSALTRLEFFSIEKDKDTAIPLIIRQAENALPVLGSFNAEMLYLPEGSESECSILSTTGRGWFIIAVVGEAGDEPSNHALRQFDAAAAEINDWGHPAVILRGSSSAALTRSLAGKPAGQESDTPAETGGSAEADRSGALTGSEALTGSLSPSVPGLNAAHYGFDMDGKVAGMLAGGVSAENPRLPIVVVGDSFGRIVYYSQGYNTSLAEDLRSVIERL